jgi:hypothetical protein
MQVNINIEKKHFYGIVLAICFLGAGFFVQAYGGIMPAIMGHTFGELNGDLGGRDITLTNGKLKLGYTPSAVADVVDKEYVDDLTENFINEDYLEERLAQIGSSKGWLGDVKIICESLSEEDTRVTCIEPRAKIIEIVAFSAALLDDMVTRKATCIALGGITYGDYESIRTIGTSKIKYAGTLEGGWKEAIIQPGDDFYRISELECYKAP